MTTIALPRGTALFERNARAHSRHFLIIFSGFFEPLFYLFFFVCPRSTSAAVAPCG